MPWATRMPASEREASLGQVSSCALMPPRADPRCAGALAAFSRRPADQMRSYSNQKSVGALGES